MVSTEHLNQLWLKLTNPQLLDELKNEVKNVFEVRNYTQWTRSEPRAPFEFSKGDALSFPLLMQMGLIKDQILQVKINRIVDRVFLTDGAWVSHPLRVFPDPDEALVLLNYVRDQGLEAWADWVIDPASGCGHTPLGYQGKARRFFCDANARALTFANINARLNNLKTDQAVGLLNDMRMGFPEFLKIDGNVLFLSNVPFAPAPHDDALVLNSGGGKTGADLQVASFEMVKKFRQTHSGNIRACFLTWTLGNAENSKWQVPEICREIFPEAKVQWRLLDHDYDAPELPNPAPLKEMLLHLARSQYAVNATSRESKVEEAYLQLSKILMSEGFTHIAYGMLECEIH